MKDDSNKIIEQLFPDKNTKKDEVIEVAVGDLFPFKNHPFQVNNDAELEKLKESIYENGVVSPIIVRKRVEGGFELISGHRRTEACKQLGIEKVPVLVRELTDEAATILMVDSNIQRENIKPSEKAFAFKMKLEALKRQGQRADNETSCQVGTKSRADEKLAEETGESARTIQRYIRLTELIPEILQMVDEKKIAFNPAVEISYLLKMEQKWLYDVMESEQSTPSLSQAQKLKQISSERRLIKESIYAVISQQKGNQKETINFSADTFAKFFPEDYTKKQMEEIIKKALEQWNQRQQREHQEYSGYER